MKGSLVALAIAFGGLTLPHTANAGMTVPIHTSGYAYYYADAYNDAASQGTALCQSEGGTVTHQEAYFVEPVGPTVIVYVLTLCYVP